MVAIKESLEVMEGLKALGIAAKKISADGKVNLADLPEILALLQKVQLIVESVKGVDQIPAEIKDLSEEESKELLAKLFEVMAAIKAA